MGTLDTQWEYQSVRLKHDGGSTDQQLNNYGKDGWEAWAINIDNWNGHYVRLKRQVSSVPATERGGGK